MQVTLSDGNPYTVSVYTELYNAYVSFYALDDGMSFRAHYNLGYEDIYTAEDLLNCIVYFQTEPIEFINGVSRI